MSTALIQGGVLSGTISSVPKSRRTMIFSLAPDISVDQRSYSRLESVQVLRGLAAAAVLLAHIALELRRNGVAPSDGTLETLILGGAGVDVFFVISGFVMLYASASHFGSARNAGRFLLKRICRIVPVYWFYTAAILAVTLFAPALLRHSALTQQYVMASFFFIPHARPDNGEITPILDLGWTLNYEIYFYVLFAVALLFDRKIGFPLLCFLFISAVIFGTQIDPTHSAPWFWSRPIILEFLVGAMIGLMFKHGVRLPAAAAYILAALALFWIAFLAPRLHEDMRVIAFGIPAALLVTASTIRKSRESRSHAARLLWAALLVVGDASYSLYLCHMFVVRAATKLLDGAALGALFVPLYLVFVFAVAIAAAIASFRLIEKPSQRLLERWLDLSAR